MPENKEFTVLDVFNHGFDIENAIHLTATDGYYFESGVVTPRACEAMENEVDSLDMRVGNHVTKPINQDKPNEVKQLHARGYYSIDDEKVPIANTVSNAATIMVNRLANVIYPELKAWSPTEAGYQNYRNKSDHIGTHRDRKSDQFLAFTITINGFAKVLIRETLGDPDDYKNTRVIDEFMTNPGSAMFLRAPGLQNGHQVLHEVLPPEQGSRLILNLRMRPDILPSPKETT